MRGSGVFWPLSLPVLVVLLLAVMAGLVQVGTLVYAYERIGIDRSWLLALLGLSIVGSTVNLPVARLRSSVVLWPQVIRVYGIRCLLLARPVKGVGIVLPGLVPPVVAAITALAISEPLAPALAYVAGVLGTLVGADLLNLPRIRKLGAPVASIGGAGTFDGIFLSGLLAVLIATL